MLTKQGGENRKRTAKEIYKRRTMRCERCGRKIKAGRYCYYCGRFKGLW